MAEQDNRCSVSVNSEMSLAVACADCVFAIECGGVEHGAQCSILAGNYSGGPRQGRLIGVGIIDYMTHGISSNMFFW